MDRYSRILELSSFSEEKLKILQSKNILVIGSGGVGQHIALYLATNGIEHLTLVDFDFVEMSNLNRQILLSEFDLSHSKVEVVRQEIQTRNSNSRINSINIKVNESNIDKLVQGYDVIVDAVDNWPTKLLISNACKKYNLLSLHVGVDGENGQYVIFHHKQLCDIVDKSIINEPKDGVLGPMVGVISSLASLLLIRYLVGDSFEEDTLFTYNSTTNQIRKVKL